MKTNPCSLIVLAIKRHYLNLHEFELVIQFPKKFLIIIPPSTNLHTQMKLCSSLRKGEEVCARGPISISHAIGAPYIVYPSQQKIFNDLLLCMKVKSLPL